MRWKCFYVVLVVSIHFAVSENCYTKQCLNGATCQMHVGFVTCVCPVGYTGSRCETEILECSSNPCKNGANCSERIAGYRCSCTQGFAGTHCEAVMVTRCERSECSNAGTCTHIGNNITCSCDEGFTGERCEKVFQGCRPVACLRGEACENKTETWVCTLNITITGKINFCDAVKGSYGSWPETIRASIAQLPCTSAAEKGTFYRTCLSSGWGQVINNCSIDHEFIADVIDQISDLNSTRQKDIPDTLLNITKTLNNLSNNSKITDDVRDMKDLAKASEKLVEYVEIHSDKITDSITDNMLGTINNFLDENKQDAWDKINKERKTTSVAEPVGAATILSTADRFLTSLRNSKCDALDMNSTEQKDNKNMYVELGRRSQSSVQFPGKKSFGSSIEIPQQSITGLSEACFVGAIYPTIGAVLEKDVYLNGSWRNGSDVTEINSDVVGLQVKNIKSGIIDPPVTITLSLKKTGYINPVCVFWDFNITRSGRRGGWSTEGCRLASITNNRAKCQCNHLTNFAIFMSPSTISLEHAKALGIVSAVGCAVSIVCLIVTLVIHAFVWRLVRSDRVIVVMHLCVALLCALILFLGGVNRTKSRGACAAIAAAIQYFFLVMFFMMLLIGVEIFICVVHVFMNKFRTKILVPIAWIIPGIIVGVSLGITKTQGYGNSKFCWLDISSGLIWSFVGPALFVICVNILVVIVVLKRMSSSAAMKTKTKKEQLKTGLYSLCVLMPVVGLTWVFGVLAINDDMWILQYIFAIMNGLQGFSIFLFYCVLNRKVRDALRRRQDRKRSLQTLSSDLRKQSHSASQEKWNNSKTPGQPAACATDDNWMREERRQYHRNIRLSKPRRLANL